MKGRIQSVSVGMEDGQCYFSASVPRHNAQELASLKGQDVDIECKKHRDKRSLSANALLWAVCEEIAQALNITKLEVYRKAIREVGVYQPLPIRDDAVDAFCRMDEAEQIGIVLKAGAELEQRLKEMA